MARVTGAKKTQKTAEAAWRSDYKKRLTEYRKDSRDSEKEARVAEMLIDKPRGAKG